MLLKRRFIVEKFKFTRMLYNKDIGFCEKCIYNSISHDEYDCRDVNFGNGKLIRFCLNNPNTMYPNRKYYYVITGRV